jgi:hypothetical protein
MPVAVTLCYSNASWRFRRSEYRCFVRSRDESFIDYELALENSLGCWKLELLLD